MGTAQSAIRMKRCSRADEHTHQNLNLAVSSMVRIAPTEMTRPNVGEFTTVSIPEYCGVLKTFES